MRKPITMTIAAALAVFASAVRAESLSAIELSKGDNTIQSPARAVALHAISTNASGTVVLKKVTALSYAWTDVRVLTNVTYTTVWSNLTHTVTNDIVSAWRTNVVSFSVSSNGVTNLVVQTNFLGRAVNAIPSVYPWEDLWIATQKVESVEVYTNIPYSVASGRTVERTAIPRQITKFVTNDILSVTLSDGFKTNAVNCLFAPGDYIVGSGSAFNGGRVQLIISR